jgi:hypothetical protein
MRIISSHISSRFKQCRFLGWVRQLRGSSEIDVSDMEQSYVGLVGRILVVPLLFFETFN